MLCSMQLENFKAFGQRTVIPLAPITVIFGQNSAGKSSILQALSLLKQTRDSRAVEAILLPRTDAGIVDLGSFQDLLFDHDIDRTLSIRLDFDGDTSARRKRFLPFGLDAGSTALEMSFVRKTMKTEISLSDLKVYRQGGDEPLARFEPVKVPRTTRPFRYSPPAHLSWTTARSVHVTKSHEHWQRPFESAKRQQRPCLKALRELKEEFATEKGPAFHFALEDSAAADWRTRLERRLSETIELFSSDFPIDAFIRQMVKEEEETLIGLERFLPSAGIESEHTPMTMLLTHFKKVSDDITIDVVRCAQLAGATVGDLLTMLFPLGPFRKPPERYYIFTGATPRDVGYQGHQLPDLLFRHPELVRDTNEWLKRLDIGYSIKIRHLGEKDNDLYAVRLVDIRRKPHVDVGLADVGFGISQILPLVVQSLAGSDQIITIEQPEVHIHPKLQADLGDLLMEAIKEPRRNQFIIESHSEHLVLRLLRRIREKKLLPTDVSVVFVSRGPQGATVQPLRLDEEGDFVDDCPGGFFPERLRELR